MDHLPFLIKGALAFTGVVMLVWHMTIRSRELLSKGTIARYVALLCFALAVGYASVEQIRYSHAFEGRHVGAMIAIIVLNIAMVRSIYEDRRCSSRAADC